VDRRLLILDGSIHTDIYHPAEEWIDLAGDVPADSVHLPSGEPVPDLERYSHVIVSGSEASVVEHQPWFDVEVEAVRRAFDLGRPLLGSCFGHQILAVALSGAEYARSTPTPEIGWIDVDVFAPDELFDGLPNPWRAFAFHSDEVRDPPPPWRVMARTGDCEVHVMRHGDRPIWGIQAHPEIHPAHARELMEGYVRYAPDKAGAIAAALASEPRDDMVAREIVRRFLAY
jgi:GMP synthase-like glutamine amidotransferase